MPVNTKKCPTPGCGDECPADLDYCPACGTELPAGRAPTAIEQLDAPQAPSSAPSAKPAQRQRDKTIITGHEADDTIELQRLGPELKPQGKPYRFEDRTTFTIGREVADILLQTDTQVSKTHAKVWISGSQCLLDAVEGSTNGVFIRLPKGDQWELQDGDEILMASEFLKFSHPGGSVAHEPTPKSTVSSDDDLIGGNMMDGAAESPGAGMATPPGSGGRAPTEFHLRKSSIRGGLSGMSSASERAGATGSGATPSREDVPGAKSSLNARRSPSKEFKTEVLGISDPRPMAHVSR
jgi:pSer/pThr/pTyr-binding forkhead associated (FHA) protein